MTWISSVISFTRVGILVVRAKWIVVEITAWVGSCFSRIYVVVIVYTDSRGWNYLSMPSNRWQFRPTLSPKPIFDVNITLGPHELHMSNFAKPISSISPFLTIMGSPTCAAYIIYGTFSRSTYILDVAIWQNWIYIILQSRMVYC